MVSCEPLPHSACSAGGRPPEVEAKVCLSTSVMFCPCEWKDTASGSLQRSHKRGCGRSQYEEACGGENAATVY